MRILLVSILFSFPFIVFADVYYAGGAGLLLNENNNNADINGSMREEVSFSWFAGSRILYEIKDTWALRTGPAFQQKSALYSYENVSGNGDVRLSVISLTLPIQIQWKLHKYFSPFAGYGVDFNLSDDCNVNGNADDDCAQYGDMKSVIHHGVVGGSFHIHGNWDLDLSYQRAINDTFTDVKIHSLVLQAFYKID